MKNRQSAIVSLPQSREKDHFQGTMPEILGLFGVSDSKDLPAIQKAQVQSLGWEDPLEEGMTTNSSILAWRVPVDRGAWWGHKKSDMTERLSTFDDNKV